MEAHLRDLAVRLSSKAFLLVLISTPWYFAASPSITAVTNAAIPVIDAGHGIGPVFLAPRSMATIFGSNLASTTVSTSPPWKQTLGGVEVHLVTGPTFPCKDCDNIADLIFVSPAQINFVIPEFPGGSSRIVLVRDGVPFDLFGCNPYGCPPGAITVNSSYYDQAVFQVGYECLFSFSVTDPSTCGVSWSPGPKRAPIGAVSDVLGRLVMSQNPVHQGQSITFAGRQERDEAERRGNACAKSQRPHCALGITSGSGCGVAGSCSFMGEGAFGQALSE